MTGSDRVLPWEKRVRILRDFALFFPMILGEKTEDIESFMYIFPTSFFPPRKSSANHRSCLLLGVASSSQERDSSIIHIAISFNGSLTMVKSYEIVACQLLYILRLLFYPLLKGKILLPQCFCSSIEIMGVQQRT